MLDKKAAFLDHCTYTLFLAEKSHYGTNHHQENADHGRGAIDDIVDIVDIVNIGDIVDIVDIVVIVDIVDIVAQVFIAALIFAHFACYCLARESCRKQLW